MTEWVHGKITQSEPFEYNKISTMDIDFDEKLLHIDKIKTDGYEIGVNHRPLRPVHVNKIKSNFSGDMVSLKVVFDYRDGFYHIVQGQHVFTAFKELMSEGKIEPKDTINCGIIKRKTNGTQLDASNPEDRRICFEYSFRVTDSQERNCISNKIAMVLELSDRYKQETGKVHGVIDYIYEHQYGYSRLSKETIKLYKNYGENLKTLGLLEQAQRERWVVKVIDSKIKDYKLKSKRMKELRIRLPDSKADELQKLGITDSDLWITALEKGHAFKDNLKIFIVK